MKITVQAILWLLAIFLAGCNRNGSGLNDSSATNQQPDTNVNALSNQTVVANETIPQPVPIEGLFGVKLGEPLPPSCEISSASEISPGGFYAIIFTPPETNASFQTYVVYLDATRRVVALISGQATYDDTSEFERIKDAIVAKFRERYGEEEMGGSDGDYWYKWKLGKRNITLDESIKFNELLLSCTDKDLYDSVEKSKPPVDTRGL